jgi:hypothetical protein
MSDHPRQTSAQHSKIQRCTSVQEPLMHIQARPGCYLMQPSSAKLYVIPGPVGPGLSLTSVLGEPILLTLPMVSQVL